jgi:hypothetical protein
MSVVSELVALYWAETVPMDLAQQAQWTKSTKVPCTSAAQEMMGSKRAQTGLNEP